jgi:uncharacterized protein (DUF1697 family)
MRSREQVVTAAVTTNRPHVFLSASGFPDIFDTHLEHVLQQQLQRDAQRESYEESPMKYVALLRGINVGGNNRIKMEQLRACFEAGGFQQVMTYIQSGNVIFESEDENRERLTREIEESLSQTFNYTARIVLRSYMEIQKVVKEAPDDWNTRTDLRCNVAFIKEPVTAEEAWQEIPPKEGIDVVTLGHGVLYLSTKLSGLTKSALGKLVSKKIYQDMTIRNYTTTQKLLTLMGQQ